MPAINGDDFVFRKSIFQTPIQLNDNITPRHRESDAAALPQTIRNRPIHKLGLARPTHGVHQCIYAV